MSVTTLPLAVMLLVGFTSHAQITNFHRLYSFGASNQIGIAPKAGVIVGSDGYLYGTTAGGGHDGYGAVFRVLSTRSDYVVLHDFAGGSDDGAAPEAALVEGKIDGALYGTTLAGGMSGGGTVFKLNKDGSGYSVLHHFGGLNRGNDGRRPSAGLLEGSDGKLYGTTYDGGARGYGTAFRLNKDGTGYQLIRQFDDFTGDGTYVFSVLTEGSDGALYGTAAEWGTIALANRGTVFKLNKDGSGFLVLKSFLGAPTEPANVQPGLIEGSDGVLYGMSSSGGVADLGTVFKIQKSGLNMSVLHHFGAGSDGRTPLEELMEGQDGALYGTTYRGGTNSLGTVFKINKDGSSYLIIRHFQGGTNDGANPRSKLAQAPSGEILGTTEAGGPENRGTVFSIQIRDVIYRIVWPYKDGNGDGQAPTAGLVEGPDGLLYGTASAGGSAARLNGGVIFRINKEGGDYSILRHFGTTSTDATHLENKLIVGSDGKLYGTSIEGGNNGGGTVFRMNRDGTGYEVLHDFAQPNPTVPYAGVIEASDGFLYGTTRRPAVGAIYKISKSGTGYEILRYLKQFEDGAEPQAALIEGSDGLLYGTTPIGGPLQHGTVFRIGSDGSNFIVLHHFSTAPGEPDLVHSSLLEASDGVLYGTSYAGGIYGGGAVFKMNKDGTGYNVLHHFPLSIGNARQPRAALVEGRDGTLYGTTQYNGTNFDGAVFKIRKDGNGFMVLHEFSGKDGTESHAVLLAASDGSLYGTTIYGGDLNLGAIFRVGHLLGMRKGTAIRLDLAGIPGYSYEVQRSADLQNWSVVYSGIMPTSARVGFDDAPAPPERAFYRVKP